MMDASERMLHSYYTVCFAKFQQTPATLLWDVRHLGLDCRLSMACKNFYQEINENEFFLVYVTIDTKMVRL